MKLAAACASMEVKAKPSRAGKRTRASGGTAGAPMAKVLMEKEESEKERRQRMKGLCEKLSSLIPKEYNPHADTMTQLGSLDVAASYIKKLKERVDELQRKKTSVQAMATLQGVSGISTPTTTSSGAGSLEGEKYLEASPTVVEVRQPDDSSMEVRLICSTERPIKLHEVITIHEEEGADIVNANHSVAGHKIFYTIHSQAFSTRIGIDVSRITERLRALAMPCMSGDRVIGYADGTSAAPPKELVTNKDKGKNSKVINSEYESCTKQDQMLTSLLASISLDMLGHVPAVPTMAEPFSTLGCMFYSKSNAKIFHVRGQLANMRKNDLSANDYFNKVNELDDTMALEGSPLTEEHSLSYLLGGLNSDYNSMLSLIMTQNKLVSLGDQHGGDNRDNERAGLGGSNTVQQGQKGGDNHFHYSNNDNGEC